MLPVEDYEVIIQPNFRVNQKKCWIKNTHVRYEHKTILQKEKNYCGGTNENDRMWVEWVKFQMKKYTHTVVFIVLFNFDMPGYFFFGYRYCWAMPECKAKVLWYVQILASNFDLQYTYSRFHRSFFFGSRIKSTLGKVERIQAHTVTTTQFIRVDSNENEFE